MVISKKTTARKNINSNTVSLEEKLWTAADKMRGHVEAAKYKHIVSGLIFLKYISDMFDEYYDNTGELLKGLASRKKDNAGRVFQVPQEACWLYLEGNTENADLAHIIDEAMIKVEEANPSLQGIFPKNYAQLSQNNYRLGELVKLIGTLGLGVNPRILREISV